MSLAIFHHLISNSISVLISLLVEDPVSHSFSNHDRGAVGVGADDVGQIEASATLSPEIPLARPN
tara:strand:- start:77 stop:271 length:195 start_codon:yes stop_codon:yes gene_type:complete